MSVFYIVCTSVLINTSINIQKKNNEEDGGRIVDTKKAPPSILTSFHMLNQDYLRVDGYFDSIENSKKET